MVKSRAFQDGWWLMLITIVCMIGSSALCELFLKNKLGTYAIMIIGELSLVIPFIIGLFMMKKHKNDNCPAKISLGISGFPPEFIPFLLLLPICAQYFSTYVTLPISLIMQILFGVQDQTELVPIPNGWLQMTQAILVLCVLAPIFEEFLCRGVLMTLFRRYGFVVELIGSSAAFALLHFDMQSFIPLFFVGLLLGFIRRSTGSIFASMLVHGANNAFSFAMTLLTNKNALPDNILLTIVLGCAAVFPILFISFLRGCDKYFDWRKDIYCKGDSISGASAALVICVLAFGTINALTIADRIKSGALIDDFKNFNSAMECISLFIRNII
ncbi:MAG: CPBP family intramembrane metalloprotease [Clostridia bacterium]|nr:CPBP family intramembrane metalloprotease [Clostridia bacterium]